MFPLEGEWEFYWKQLLGPEDFTNPAISTRKMFIHVPGTWGNTPVSPEVKSSRKPTNPLNREQDRIYRSSPYTGQEIGKNGFATYRLILRGLPEDRDLALYVPLIFMASKVWVNGRLVSSVGMVGKNSFTEIPGWTQRVIPLPHKDNIEVIMNVSDFTFQSGGMRTAPAVGPRGMVKRYMLQSIFITIFIAGALFIMGAYHLILFFFRRKDLTPLFFGIFSLILAIYTMVGTDDHILSSIFPHIPWHTLYMSAFLTYYIAIPLFVAFLRSLYPFEFPSWLLPVSVTVSTAFAISLFLLSPSVNGSFIRVFDIITKLTGMYLVYILIKASRNKREGALLLLLGGTVLYVTLVHDVLYDFEFVRSGNLIPFGVLTFMVFQTAMLSMRFARAFARVERQERALERSNIDLEKRVRDRTARLETSMREKDILLRELHHRVKNNLQTIVSLLNIKLDEVSDLSRTALIESRNRVQAMAFIHEGLYNAPNLAVIDFESYTKSIIVNLFETFGVEKDDIRLEINISRVHIDMDTSVCCGLILNELVSNCLKHAFPEDQKDRRISISFYESSPEYFSFIVADNGKGLPEDIRPETASSFGLRLVYGLITYQLKGSILVESGDETRIVMSIPKKRRRDETSADIDSGR